jgi:uncharacterized protein (DUF2336 family)
MERQLYGDVFERLLHDLEGAVKAELAKQFSTHLCAPRNLIRALANDEIDVAGDVLRSSPVLTDSDLIEVANGKGQEHLRAVSERASVSEALSDVIVRRGDDTTLHTLLANDGAHFSRLTSEAVVERAKVNPALHDVTVDRRSLPLDLLNELYFVVGGELRRRIVARNASLDQTLLEQALSSGVAKIATADGVFPADYAEALARINSVRTGSRLLSTDVARILRSGSRTAFCIAIAEMSDVDFATVSRIVEQGEIDGLAVLCRGAELDGPLFLTIALSILGNTEGALGKARSYALYYAELTPDAASRTLRFWRMRRSAV